MRKLLDVLRLFIAIGIVAALAYLIVVVHI
jgi:hypothetical protein